MLTKLSRTMNPLAGNRQWQRTAGFVLVTVMLLNRGLAGAAGWELDPVRVELSSQQQTATLTVKNSSDQTTSIQIQAVTWAQQNGKDIYTPTKELLVTPPIFTIAPKSEQIIRVGLRREADSTNELDYRLILQELPAHQSPKFMGVNVTLRVTLPVFVQSLSGSVVPKMVWHVSRMPDNRLKVVVQNTGNVHIQISDFALYALGETKPFTGESGSSYVLAGQTHEWLLKPNSLEKILNNRLRLTAFTDANNVDTEIVLLKP